MRPTRLHAKEHDGTTRTEMIEEIRKETKRCRIYQFCQLLALLWIAYMLTRVFVG